MNRSPHEARVFEDTNVLGDSGEGHLVGRGELGHRRAARSQLIQDTTADRMGDRGVNSVKLSGGIFNQLVERTLERFPRQVETQGCDSLRRTHRLLLEDR